MYYGAENFGNNMWHFKKWVSYKINDWQNMILSNYSYNSYRYSITITNIYIYTYLMDRL